MHRIIIFIFISFFSVLIISCQGTREKELKKLDELWGYCDNPHREFQELEYQTCKRKERSKQPSGKTEDMEPFNLTGFIDKVRDGETGSGFTKANVNPFLWQGSIDVTSEYDLKIADATGGYIQTEWIYDESASNNRCMIKIQILSADFISTGVKSKFLCENKNQEIWKTDEKEYLEEEKILTLQILEASQKYSSSALN
mgnify:FL=1